MIAKAKVISHGANAIRYSVDKDKAEIVKTNLSLGARILWLGLERAGKTVAFVRC